MRAIWLGGVGVVFVLFGCQEPPPPKTFAPFTVEGITVPGGFDHAEATGFTSCDAGYYGYACKRASGAEVFGVRPIAATLSLNGDHNFRQDSVQAYARPSTDARNLQPEQLSYRSVELQFSQDQYDERCLKAKGAREEERPEACLTTKGVHAFVAGLKRAGWVLAGSAKGHAYFLNPGAPVEISVTTHKSTATFRPEPLDSVGRRLEEVARGHQADEAKRANAQKVLEKLQAPDR
jgi:hypothetical protein